MKYKFITILILLLFSSTWLSAQTFYVDLTGDDIFGDGSIGNPWATIQHAINTVPPFSEIRVMPGIHNLTGAASPAAGIDIDKSLTLVANDWILSNDNATTMLMGVDPPPMTIDIRITQADVIIQGFTIDFNGAGTRSYGAIEINGDPNLQNIHILNNIFHIPDGDPGYEFGEYVFRTGGSNDCSGLLIQNNTFYADGDHGGFGIYLNPAPAVTDVLIDNNTFSGGLIQGIIVDGMPNVTVSNNILNTTVVDASMLAAAPWNNTTNVTFEDNEIGTGGPNMGGNYGIRLGSVANGKFVTTALVSGNTIQGTQSYGIKQDDASGVTIMGNSLSDNPIGLYVVGGSTTTITDNSIFDNSAEGILITGGTIGPINENTIYGNSTYGLNNTSGTSIDATINWWGDANGPYHATTNDTSGGDEVSDDVIYSPWLGNNPSLPHPWTFVINSNNPDGLEAANNAASDGDIIIVGAGTYNAFTITKEITLQTDDDAKIINGSPAITVSADNVTITGFIFDFITADYAIWVNDGYSGIEIHNCFFLTSNGVNNLTTAGTVVDAEDNWWGSPDGPDGAGSGTGSNISVNVDYDPWLTWWGTTYAPINGITGVSVEPTFSWDALSNATSYVLYVDDNEDFSSPLYEVDQGLNLTKSMTELITNFPLDNNTLYYWKVAAVVNATEYDSDTWHFTTVPVVTVYQTHPGDGTTVYSTATTLYWYTSTITGTASYNIQISQQTNEPTPAEWTGAASFSTANLNQPVTVLEGKKYWWRVIVLNADDEVISYSAAWSFTVIGGATITIYQTWPIGGATVYTTSPTVYWYTDQYPLGVEYQVWYNELGDTNHDGYLNDEADKQVSPNPAGTYTADINRQLNNLDPVTTYHWQVEGYVASTGESVFSDIESFVTNGTGTLAQPLLSYPTGGIILYSTSTWLYWYTGTSNDGLTFDVYYKEQGAGGWTGPLHQAAGLSYQLTGLTPGVSYEWKVAANNGVTTMESVVETFSIVGGTSESYTVATWPLGDLVYTRTPTLYWYLQGSPLGVTKFTVRVKAGSNSTDDWATDYDDSYDVTPLTTTSYTFSSNLDFEETYYWAVAAYHGAPISAYSDWSEGAFTIYGIASAIAPTLTSPDNGTTLFSRSPALYWFINGSTVGFQSYTLLYSYSDVFAPAATTTLAGITDNFYALNGLTPGATYWWYVTSVYTQGSATSATWSFTVDPGASSVQPMIGGPNNISVHTTAPVLSWALPVISLSALTYQLEVADNSDFTNAIVYEGLTVPYQGLSGLESGKEYYWRVRSKNELGETSYYSGIGRFRVGANVTDVSDNEIIPTDFRVSQNYPNPFNPTTTINYSLNEGGYVSIRIFDMLGREIKTLVDAEMNAGVYAVNWNGDDNLGNKVSSGTYIYRVIAGKNAVTKKMVLLK